MKTELSHFGFLAGLICACHAWTVQADTRTSVDYLVRSDVLDSAGGTGNTADYQLLGSLGVMGSVIQSTATDVKLLNGFIGQLEEVTGPLPFVVANNLYLSATDTNLEGRAVTVNSNATLTVAGQHQLASLTIYGIVTHSQGDTNGVNLTVDGAVNVAVGGRIDVSAQGYLGGRKAGNASPASGETRGTNGLPALGAINLSGGSYGSIGGVGGGGTSNPLYGSAVAPVDLGSGGGGACCGEPAGGNGGGRIHLRAHSLLVAGALRANGEVSSNRVDKIIGNAGGGSGGSILVELSGGTFAGDGVIEAKGGLSTDPNRYGGGGRIAVVGYATNDYAGQPVRAATVFTQAAGTGGHLQLDGTILGYLRNFVAKTDEERGSL